MKLFAWLYSRCRDCNVTIKPNETYCPWCWKRHFFRRTRMTDLDLAAIRERNAGVLSFTPPPPRTDSVVYRHISEDVPALLAEVERLREREANSMVLDTRTQHLIISADSAAAGVPPMTQKGWTRDDD